MYRFADANVRVDEFEALLRRHGVGIAPGSLLEDIALKAKALEEARINPDVRPSESEALRNAIEMIGFQDIAGKLLRAENHPDFSHLYPHLQSLNNPLQNTPSLCTDQTNNKAFELYLAALLMGMESNQIELDNPRKSTGTNPDVIACYGGVRWGFACKVLHSDKTQTIFGNIEKAVQQIGNSNAEKGFAVINAKNIIGNEIYGKIYNNALHVHETLEILHNKLRTSILSVYRDDAIKLFHGEKSEPACLIYYPTVVKIPIIGVLTLSRINQLGIMHFGDIAEEMKELSELINIQMQII